MVIHLLSKEEKVDTLIVNYSLYIVFIQETGNWSAGF